MDVGLGWSTGGTPESRVIRGDDAVAPRECPHLGFEHPAVEREGVEQDQGIPLPKFPVRHRYAGSHVIHYGLLWLAFQHFSWSAFQPCNDFLHETIAADDGSVLGW